MIEFNGFPARIKQFTPIPNLVFSSLLPQINDITELKALFYIFELIYPKRGNLRFVTYNELLSHTEAVNDPNGLYREKIYKALEGLVNKHIILHLTLQSGEKQADIYFLNNETNQLVVEKIKSREIVLSGIKFEAPMPVNLEEKSDIFTLYEQNIGMLTPLIADELKEANKQYPEIWIKNAIKEAVAQNKRSWRYVSRILEHWVIEGKANGAYRGNLKKNTDPDKFIKGKYGHMVQR